MIKKKMQMTGLAVVLLGSAVMPPSPSAAGYVDDAGSWLQAVGEGSLKSADPSLENVRLWLEGQSRWDDDWNHWYQGMIRAAVGYSLSDRATIWAGYTWLPTHNLIMGSLFMNW